MTPEERKDTEAPDRALPPSHAQPHTVMDSNPNALVGAEKKLEISERRLRYVLEATGEGIWDWDVASDVVTHNRRWCEIAGLDDNFLQHPLAAFIDLLHEEDRPAVEARVQACLSGAGRYESEHRLRRSDGQVVWVHDRGAVVERDAQGQPLRVVGSVGDISARKASELAAQRASQLLHEAVEHIAVGFSIFDEQDRLYLCNEAYRRIYEDNRALIVPGNSFESIVRQGAQQGRYRLDDGNVEAWVQQRLAQHHRANGEVREYHLVDGRCLLVTESRTPSGFVVGNRLDITESKKTEALVLEHAEQLKAIFDLSPDGFVTFDREHRVKSLNPAFGRLTGLDGAALLGLDEHLFSQALAQRCEPSAVFPGVLALREKKRLLANPAPGHADMDVQRQLIELSGPVARVLEVRLRLSTLPDVSQILYVRDVTHEAEVERLKSKFMSMAAHELRNPMASIYGFTEILNTHDLSDDERKEFLDIIYRQSEHMMAILNELLDLARIEARRGQDFVFEPLSAQALVDGVVKQFKLPPDRLPPQCVAPDEALFVLADPRKAAQAVLNVLSNAYKYSTGPVRIVIAPKGDGVAVSVHDQGIVMTPAETKLVGTPFYRSDTSGRVLGTGLGLSIVKEIMKLHRGRIDIDSTLGQGTQVDLVFCTNRFFPVVQQPS